MELAELFMKSMCTLPIGKYIFEDWQKLSAPPCKAELFSNNYDTTTELHIAILKEDGRAFIRGEVAIFYDNAVC